MDQLLAQADQLPLPAGTPTWVTALYVVGGGFLMLFCTHGVPTLLSLWRYKDKRTLQQQRYDDGKESKGMAFVIEKQEGDIEDRDRRLAALESKLEVKDREYVESIKVQERLKTQNEGLQADLNRERESREVLAKELAEAKAEIKRLWVHAANNEKGTEDLRAIVDAKEAKLKAELATKETKPESK